MRFVHASLGLLAVTAGCFGGAADAVVTPAGCAARLPHLQTAPPAPIAVTTICGRFVFGPDGRVRRTSTDPQPVPRHVAAWWPSSGVWERLDHGHLVVGLWQRRLWRSQRRFPLAYEVDPITVGAHALAFSYGWRVPRLYLAPVDGHERMVTRGEFPLGWTASGVYAHRAPGQLLLRSRRGALRKILARQVSTYAYDQGSGSLYFVERGMLMRADGRRVTRLASLAALALSPGPSFQLQPLGPLVALLDGRRLVVVSSGGSWFAAARLPRGRPRGDGTSSSVAAAPDARAVAFTSARGNTGYGSTGTETVYLLRSATRHAVAVHRERINFAVCGRQADVVWYRRWLLYSASEGKLVVIDSNGVQRPVDLSRALRRLPGTAGDEGSIDFNAYWAGEPNVHQGT